MRSHRINISAHGGNSSYPPRSAAVEYFELVHIYYIPYTCIRISSSSSSSLTSISHHQHHHQHRHHHYHYHHHHLHHINNYNYNQHHHHHHQHYIIHQHHHHHRHQHHIINININIILIVVFINHRRGMLELHKSSGIDDVGKIKWQIALCLFIVYIICYFSLWKGISTSGKVEKPIRFFIFENKN